MPSLVNLLLFPQGRALVGRAFDLGRLELAGEPIAVADNLSVYDTGKTYDVAGRVAAFVDFARHTDVAWYDRSGRRIAATPVGDRASWIDIAPDCRRFVVDIEDEESGARELWVVGDELGEARQRAGAYKRERGFVHPGMIVRSSRNVHELSSSVLDRPPLRDQYSSRRSMQIS